ncbi:hypothetical protein [Bythopirellula goksoeyrii]|uniref:Uncharacterized protein n=1 Tax=Bythopirellula goksoeyrii TaxID=1400387 RepID=A0A5B9QSJ3_9BACT|nr:hypothetical protein [Bythopirellula goksoeyrii]QEG37111.1 hypothetical protein Pr1d_44510 [Bythopirellula goksoeyrii]
MPTKTSQTSKKSSSSKQAKTSPKSRTAKSKSPKAIDAEREAGDQEVTIDRRKADNCEDASTAPQLERRTKVQRRRQIDPTTCERDYSDEEVTFMSALDEYKRKNGRMFPTCSEVLEVIRSLGYVKLSPAELAVVRPETEEDAEVSADEAAAEEEFEMETV